jgi:hypothetical protein
MSRKEAKPVARPTHDLSEENHVFAANQVQTHALFGKDVPVVNALDSVREHEVRCRVRQAPRAS